MGGSNTYPGLYRSTGKEINIPEKIVASFKAASQLKEFINNVQGE